MFRYLSILLSMCFLDAKDSLELLQISLRQQQVGTIGK